MWPIDKPIPYIRNARKIPQSAIDKVAGSLKEFGWRQPIVVDTSGVIIVGHTRLKGAKKLGLKEVPIHIADKLNESQVKAYRLADNRTGQETKWDEELLSLELKELTNLNLDMDLTGFDDKEINKIINLYEETSEGKTDENLIPDEITSKSKPGDVWILGNHRLLHGSSTNLADVNNLFENQKADMVFTDPPYNVDYGKARASINNNWRFKERSIANDNMSDEQFHKFLCEFINHSKENVKLGSPYYICYGERSALQFLSAFKDSGLKQSCNIIWKKNALVMGRSDYHYIHEPIFYGWIDGQTHIYYGDRKQTSVWECNRPVKSKLHPTMKPVELIEFALKNSSKADDIIYEPFGGSGSTLIACEKLNRRCFTIEIDNKYCDTIIQRWEDFTGKKAIKDYGREKSRQTN